ncbi:hypothetical protein M419DRAFT_6220 [Trichoderma reesei RUT C-30]|uniref:Uncharacterized protein n=1 Tax=Hypocrea jecorina (strain ATCC 56765 / BCRC 32924 / NRRL 11460 / Rut C-30) TaxID=1344414 RepID=A0A024SHX6_HYPJR|nr:hypothetical protein M419DRAFT_6220 [Trichoderma reesei RUT C-30]
MAERFFGNRTSFQCDFTGSSPNSGFVDSDPKKTKKDGSAKGNWGRACEEDVDKDFLLLSTLTDGLKSLPRR